MDRDIFWILFILGFAFVFGGWQGLYNLGYVTVFWLGLIALILITFFKKDLIIISLKAIFDHFFSKRRR